MSRVVLITGASGGLGQALSRSFSKHHDRLILHYYKNEQFKFDQDHVDGRRVDYYQADLRDQDAVKGLFQHIRKQYGCLDVLICSAGIIRDKLFVQMHDEDWDEVIRVNLTAVFLCMKYAHPLMLGEGLRSIINIASISGIVGREGQSNYASSKAGLIALTKTAAMEFKGSDIQVMNVVPGLMPTRMSEKLVHHRSVAVLDEIADFIFSLTCMRHVTGQTWMLEDRIGPFDHIADSA